MIRIISPLWLCTPFRPDQGAHVISCVIAFVVEICDRNCDSFCDSNFGPDLLHYRIHFRIRSTFSVHVYAQEHTSIYVCTHIYIIRTPMDVYMYIYLFRPGQSGSNLSCSGVSLCQPLVWSCEMKTCPLCPLSRGHVEFGMLVPLSVYHPHRLLSRSSNHY